jgi:hypothetical protein
MTEELRKRVEVQYHTFREVYLSIGFQEVLATVCREGAFAQFIIHLGSPLTDCTQQPWHRDRWLSKKSLSEWRKFQNILLFVKQYNSHPIVDMMLL